MSDSQPVFILGVDRSGTTLLSLMLDQHPEIGIPYESHFLIEYWRRKQDWPNLETNEDERLDLVRNILSESYVRNWDFVPATEDLNLEKCTSLTNAIDEIYSSYAGHYGKTIWGDKTPAYTSHVDVVNSLFPRAKFVHLIRDGRDVALSLRNQWWGANDFVSALQYWRETVILAQKTLSMLPHNRVLEVHFEELVRNPSKVLEQISQFLELDYSEKMLSAYQANAERKVGLRIDDHHKNLRKPPSEEMAHKWKSQLGDSDKALAFEIAGPLLRSLGYECEEVPASSFRRLTRRIFHVVRGPVVRRMWKYKRRVQDQSRDKNKC